MTTLVSQMTKEELIQVIESVIERKLLELFEDIDEALELKPDVRDRLLRQQEAMVKGERGRAFSDIVQQLDLS